MDDIEVVIITHLIFKNTRAYLLWVDYEFFENSYGKIKMFQDEDSAQEFCKNKYEMTTDVWEEDFNDLNIQDCSHCLEKWNIIGDLAKTIKEDFIGNHDDYTTLYRKFVYGSNIPALKTSGKTYVPTFDEEEQKQIECLTNDMYRILGIVFNCRN